MKKDYRLERGEVCLCCWAECFPIGKDRSDELDEILLGLADDKRSELLRSALMLAAKIERIQKGWAQQKGKVR